MFLTMLSITLLYFQASGSVHIDVAKKHQDNIFFILFYYLFFLDRLQLLSQPISQLEENINKLDKENETHDKVGSPGKPID